ncbi:YrhK family protein [Streptomyces iconiensis]|uniref:YrhK family protein n=1 Tax=Streptomyces iconiensis TaxID=1384038 RepID=A0ABT6ZUD6_9ACTN|nr:YrhK family protein [Streptomyces iconiensis]MDJ1132676.1 YrhK family protein [Streptomyces iconiensis]
MSEPQSRREDGALTLHIGRDELVVQQRYEAASVLNDILIAVWFLIGSIMFFSPEWTRAGTWCFVLGSVELMIRPAIRLGRQLHIKRLRGGAALYSSNQDYY